MEGNKEAADLSSKDTDPLWLTTEYGMWVNMETETVNKSPEIAKVVNDNETPPASDSNPEASNCDSGSGVAKDESEDKMKAPAEPNQQAKSSANTMEAPACLDDIGQRIFKELMEECQEVDERRSRRGKKADKIYQQSLDKFMNAEKWTVKQVNGKTGFYANVGVHFQRLFQPTSPTPEKSEKDP